jgi:hypothetical protein
MAGGAAHHFACRHHAERAELIKVRIDDPAELVVFAQLTALRVLGVGE